MEEVLRIFLIVHISAGTIALIAGPLAMLTKKGGRQHRAWGNVYSYGMCIVFVTAVYLSVFKEIPFLLMIAFFSFYLVVSGYRALSYKKLHKGQRVAIGDWIFSVASFLFSLALVGWGIYKILVAGDAFGVVGIALGGLGCRLIYTGIKAFLVRPTDKKYWLYKHVTSMGGAYIATFTAFAVVNVTFLPGPVTWILPTLVGTFFIVRWKRNYQSSLQKRSVEKKLQLK